MKTLLFFYSVFFALVGPHGRASEGEMPVLLILLLALYAVKAHFPNFKPHQSSVSSSRGAR